MKKTTAILLILAMGIMTACDKGSASVEVETTESVEESVSTESVEEVEPESVEQGTESISLGETATLSTTMWTHIGDDAKINLRKVSYYEDSDDKFQVSLAVKLGDDTITESYIYDASTNETTERMEAFTTFDIKITGVDYENQTVTARIDEAEMEVTKLELSGNSEDVYRTSDYCYIENDYLVILLDPGYDMRGDYLDRFTEAILKHEENSDMSTLTHNSSTIKSASEHCFDGENPFFTMTQQEGKFYLALFLEPGGDGRIYRWLGYEPVINIEDYPNSSFSREEIEYLDSQDADF